MKSMPIHFNIFLVIILMVISCKNVKDHSSVIQSAKDYQAVIDLKIEEIIAQQGQIRQQISEQNRAKQDTFQLAKSLVPLKTAKFLLETQHDKITTNIKALQRNAIPIDSLSTVITESQAKVENIIKGNQIWE